MNRVLQRALLGGAIWFLALGGNTAAIAQSGDSPCKREGLKTITEKLFTTLEAHKPSSLPLASGLRYTENGIEVPIGKGVWETAGKTTFKRGMLTFRNAERIRKP